MMIPGVIILWSCLPSLSGQDGFSLNKTVIKQRKFWIRGEIGMKFSQWNVENRSKLKCRASSAMKPGGKSRTGCSPSHRTISAHIPCEHTAEDRRHKQEHARRSTIKKQTVQNSSRGNEDAEIKPCLYTYLERAGAGAGGLHVRGGEALVLFLVADPTLLGGAWTPRLLSRHPLLLRFDLSQFPSLRRALLLSLGRWPPASFFCVLYLSLLCLRMEDGFK